MAEIQLIQIETQEPYCHNNRSFEILVNRNLDKHYVLAINFTYVMLLRVLLKDSYCQDDSSVYMALTCYNEI